MAVSIQQSMFVELADFLVSQPTLEEIAMYKLPPAVQQYVADLLEKNQESSLSSEERLELEKIMAIADVIDLAKAKARLKLVSKA
jgi:hypothetical protein